MYKRVNMSYRVIGVRVSQRQSSFISRKSVFGVSIGQVVDVCTYFTAAAISVAFSKLFIPTL